ncbi:MAG: sulfatase [bacterium]|nr:sulfatase [bacterium]
MPIRILLLLAAASALLTLHGQSPARPNILYVIADDWSHGHAGAYGSKWVKTPGFDRIAREGVLFNNAYTSNPKCSPSRASMLTGRNTWQLKEAVNHFSVFPSEFAVFPDLLEEAGYFVGYTGKGWGPGDFRATGRTRNPAGPEFANHRLKPPHKGISAKDYARNFEDFLSQRPAGKPFYFWLGTHEPHRSYEDGSGIRAGKNPADVDLPAYYPDNATIRSDMLDYSLEVEWFDTHLTRAIAALEQAGELDHTLILVTSDHGMPFPRVKGQIYEHGFHLPLAIRWGEGIKGGRMVDDFINVRDFAPTLLAAAGLQPAGTMTGSSFLDILTSTASGQLDPSRRVMLTGKERHDLGRPNNWGYPVRAIRTPEFLYIRNYEPDRWPAGNPETGYRNCDGSPTKSFLLRSFDNFYRLSFGKRPTEELYDAKADTDNINNLADDPKYARVKRQLRERMEELLRSEGDPRLLGRADSFETITYTGRHTHSFDTWLKNHK